MKSSSNRLTPIHLYKLTPKTNCGECGFAACLAFATQVIVGAGDLDACPYMDQESIEPFREQLGEQHRAGIGVKREGFEKALQFLREEIKKWDFQTIASSLGASFTRIDGQPALQFAYFGHQVTVTSEDITDASEENLDPWEKILLYNYVIGGAVEPSRVWIGMESLPNSVSKIKSLKAHCEDRLAASFAGKLQRLPAAVAGLGNTLSLEEEKVDFAAEFKILPMLAVRVLCWDEDAEEGFEAKMKLLFDSRVLQVLDLESLLFTCEQLTERLLKADARNREAG